MYDKVHAVENGLTTKGKDTKLDQSNGWSKPTDEKPQTEHDESRLSFTLQSFFPFLLAGFGMVAAGILLDRASSWYFLTEVPEALIMVPALLGLKGNLEMTLASRLSTMANLGLMDTRKQQIMTLISNIALVQAQAIGVSLAASFLAIVTSLIEGYTFSWPRVVSLMLIAISTASIASLILSTVMVVLAIVARKWKINPDNVSTPIAAMLGDITTLAFMILLGTVLTQTSESLFIFQLILLIVFVLSTVIWALAASKNPATYEVLKHGWYIIILAMVISSCGGYVLKMAMTHFSSLAVFQPVVNGVGGNLVAVQASKISTYLHRHGKKGVLPQKTVATYVSPLRTFALKEEESVHAVLLLLMSIPGHSIFLTVISFVELGDTYDWQFYIAYVIIGMTQVSILLYICQLSCRLMWRYKLDPDNNAIPLLTSLGDLIGTSLLFTMFLVLNHIVPNVILSLESEEIPLNQDLMVT
ncbi:unnamed protein product [Bursaphelenchus okinawaensis]|uniref:SLC41A/MgtE integral membrane domain-containing protein n=1 Tax=Bursaphelenchus okinawaensis TaxID=465554 RepID=A0A811KU28_9BILA|nr:unnamed protein product [Bursaphelenchus okinawaensis]CAG9111607.1 unnamed protein product [Bursaphelenchus okinawaensis]